MRTEPNAPQAGQEPRLDLVPYLTVVVERRDDLRVLVVPRYKSWGMRVARWFRMPVRKRVLLDAEGSRVVGLIDGDRTLGEIVEHVAQEDAEAWARLFAFLGTLQARGWLGFQDASSDAKRL